MVAAETQIPSGGRGGADVEKGKGGEQKVDIERGTEKIRGIEERYPWVAR